MHWRVFLEALDLADRLDKATVHLLRAKPAGADRAADARWRRACAKAGIDTRPEGRRASPGYERARSAARRLAAAREQLAAAEEEVRALRAALARARLEARLCPACGRTHGGRGRAWARG